MSETKQYRLLLLEDNPDDAELILRRLERTGLDLQIKHVVNKAEFVEGLDSFKPDLIISDYNLPDIDGLSALRTTKERHPHLPFIIISGVLDDKFAAETLEAGVTDFILKDRPERLGSAVSRALKESEQRRLEAELAKRAEQLEIENQELHRRESRIRQLRQELLALKDQLRNM